MWYWALEGKLKNWLSDQYWQIVTKIELLKEVILFLFYSLGRSLTIISDVAHRALKNTTAMITLR